MKHASSRTPISSSSRRRLARWLVGSSISLVERDLILETLAKTHGNRTVSARLLGVSVRTLRNKITEYSAEGLDIPRYESRDASFDYCHSKAIANEVSSETAEQLKDMIASAMDTADVHVEFAKDQRALRKWPRSL